MESIFTPDHMLKIPENGERIVAGMNTVIHCHHYNSRIQRSVEGIAAVDGITIFRDAAEATFSTHLEQAKASFPERDYLEVAADLFRFLGFGLLDFSGIASGIISGSSSHFVEGWKCGQGNVDRNVCTFTEGFLQGALFRKHGKCFDVRETKCMNRGELQCEFSFREALRDPPSNYLKHGRAPMGDAQKLSPEVHSVNVDMKAIVDAVFTLPVFGNESGLIPTFNVYLANMPKDFYNLVTLMFLKKMEDAGLRDIASTLLKEDAETCGLNTFSGIMHSDEWNALIQPMIKEEGDNIFALIAVANALGWGRVRIVEHTPRKSITIQSINGYEAQGALEILSTQDKPQCSMLTGVLAGLMELIYEKGEFEERKGTFISGETACMGQGDPYCSFTSTKANASE